MEEVEKPAENEEATIKTTFLGDRVTQEVDKATGHQMFIAAANIITKVAELEFGGDIEKAKFILVEDYIPIAYAQQQEERSPYKTEPEESERLRDMDHDAQETEGQLKKEKLDED